MNKLKELFILFYMNIDDEFTKEDVKKYKETKILPEEITKEDIIDVGLSLFILISILAAIIILK